MGIIKVSSDTNWNEKTDREFVEGVTKQANLEGQIFDGVAIELRK